MIFRLVILSLFCYSAVAMANESVPTDSRLLYNHGVELAASGRFDEATEILRQVAVVRDKSLAAKALSLLGQIATTSARQLISEQPAETPPEHRQTIFKHLQSAERSFAESLALLPNEDVRQYLETLRAWRHNMNNVWETYDREQLRKAELQQRIKGLADWEEKLTEKVRPMAEEPNSPRKFQTGYEAGREQKQLAEELFMLQETPLEEIPADDDEFVEKWMRLPEIRQLADETAELLSRSRMEEALPKQQQVLDYLRTLFKQKQNQQDQQNQEQDNQEQDNQEQLGEQNQEQEQEQEQQSQPNESKDDKENKNGEQEQGLNQPQSTQQEEAAQKEEDAKEKAERQLMQVRRKEQAAEKRREQLRILQMQAEPVEKDW